MSDAYEDGRYDQEAEDLLLKYPNTLTAIVIMAGKDPGFSVASVDLDCLREMPSILRSVAGQIEEQTQAQPFKVTLRRDS